MINKPRINNTLFAGVLISFLILFFPGLITAQDAIIDAEKEMVQTGNLKPNLSSVVTKDSIDITLNQISVELNTSTEGETSKPTEVVTAPAGTPPPY